MNSSNESIPNQTLLQELFDKPFTDAIVAFFDYLDQFNKIPTPQEINL